MEQQEHPLTSKEFIDGLIRIGLILLLLVACFRVFSPFMNLMLWALILGVTLYPLNQKLAAKLGGSHSRAATAIVLTGLLLIGVPFVMLASSLADQLTGLHESYKAGTLAVPPPRESVAEWPVIGEQVYEGWEAASTNLEQFIIANRAGVEAFLGKGLGFAKSAVGGVFFFLGALIVAGIMMAYGSGGSRAVYEILTRIAGDEHGPRVHTLATMTTRSVAVGVLGVAVIQAVLMGLGFMFAGVPAAGLLALVVLLLAIMQLPATLVSLPVIIWLWNSGDAGTVMNTVWTVYLIVAGLADNVLKPILLGRGVDAPMPVILIGALGGMVSSGFIGLFLGAVILAVGYNIFMQWVDATTPAAPEAEAADRGAE